MRACDCCYRDLITLFLFQSPRDLKGRYLTALLAFGPNPCAESSNTVTVKAGQSSGKRPIWGWQPSIFPSWKEAPWSCGQPQSLPSCLRTTFGTGFSQEPCFINKKQSEQINTLSHCCLTQILQRSGGRRSQRKERRMEWEWPSANKSAAQPVMGL